MQIEKSKWTCRKWKLVFSAFNMDLPMWLLQSWQPQQKLEARRLFLFFSFFTLFFMFLRSFGFYLALVCKFQLAIYSFELKIWHMKYYICFSLFHLFIYFFSLNYSIMCAVRYKYTWTVNTDWQSQYLIICRMQL